MRRNLHFCVPKSALRLIQGDASDGSATSLAEYRWGSCASQHLFCARCGICPFYVPRSNPDGWGITFQCLDGGTATSVEVRQFDGQHWEEYIEGAGAAIKTFSKPTEEPVSKSAVAPQQNPCDGLTVIVSRHSYALFLPILPAAVVLQSAGGGLVSDLALIGSVLAIAFALLLSREAD
jgi:hypothetical protein